MNGRCFLDTNIFVYTFDSSQPEKKARARELVSRALRDSTGVVSSQVVQEFLNVATRKFEEPLTHRDCLEYLDNVLAPMCDIFASMELYHDSLEVQERWQMSFYDSLIVNAALVSGCEQLCSEDLQHGQRIKELTIDNPFRGL